MKLLVLKIPKLARRGVNTVDRLEMSSLNTPWNIPIDVPNTQYYSNPTNITISLILVKHFFMLNLKNQETDIRNPFSNRDPINLCFVDFEKSQKKI